VLDLQQKKEEFCLTVQAPLTVGYKSIYCLGSDIPKYIMELWAMFNQDIVSIQLNHYRKTDLKVQVTAQSVVEIQ
jgi:hypothetical protein